ncbi:hypothetical protein QG37_06537 [Candidozyma auris]|uniref:Uncharacterized protein n=1 Tax=Candidozyma auris TaxID=498019 RepID=A0A0L0NSE3_CANAR|nr:hypothetical protein QG37_06537 [[Candida] auris]
MPIEDANVLVISASGVSKPRDLNKGRYFAQYLWNSQYDKPFSLLLEVGDLSRKNLSIVLPLFTATAQQKL